MPRRGREHPARSTRSPRSSGKATGLFRVQGSSRCLRCGVRARWAQRTRRIWRHASQAPVPLETDGEDGEGGEGNERRQAAESEARSRVCVARGGERVVRAGGGR